MFVAYPVTFAFGVIRKDNSMSRNGYGYRVILETGDDEIDRYAGQTGEITDIERDGAVNGIDPDLITLYHMLMPDGNTIVVNIWEVSNVQSQ